MAIRFCAILLAFLLGSCGDTGPGETVSAQEAGETEKGVPTVPTIELKAEPIQRRVLAGESLPVVVTAGNVGDTPCTLPDPEEGNPFTFQLLALQGDEVLFAFSDQLFESVLNPEARPVPPPEMVELAPGATLTYDADLGKITSETVPPGKYRLVVAYRTADETLRSPATEIEIVPPDTAGLTALSTQLADSVAVLFAQRSDGGLALLQREGRPGHPGLGVVWRRNVLGPGSAPDSLTLATDGDDLFGGRWLAWLEGDRIAAAWGWGRSVMTEIEASPTGVESARMAKPGLRLDGPRAVFLAVGGDDGHRTVRACTFAFRAPPPLPVIGEPPPEPAKEPPAPNPTVETFRLDGPADAGEGGARPLPERVLARYVRTAAGRAAQLVWVESIAGVSRVYLRTIPLGGAEDDGRPRLLLERPGKPADIGMDPAGDGPGVVDLLFGPEGEERRMTYLRVPLDGGESQAEWTFEARGLLPVPSPEGAAPDENGARDAEPEVEQWAIASARNEDGPVLAKIKDRIVFTRAGAGSGWAVVASGVRSAEHLLLLALYSPDRYGARAWALWVDPSTGVQYRPVY